MQDHELQSLIRLRIISIEQLTIFNFFAFGTLSIFIAFYLKLQMIPNVDALDHVRMP